MKQGDMKQRKKHPGLKSAVCLAGIFSALLLSFTALNDRLKKEETETAITTMNKNVIVETNQVLYDVRSDKELISKAELLEKSTDGNGVCFVTYELAIGLKKNLPEMLSDQYALQAEFATVHHDGSVPTDRVDRVVIYDIEKDKEHIITYESMEAMLPDNAEIDDVIYCFADEGKWYVGVEVYAEVSGKSEQRQYLLIEAESGEITGLVSPEYIEEAYGIDEADLEYSMELDILTAGHMLRENGFSDEIYKNNEAYLLAFTKYSMVPVEREGVELWLSGYTLPEKNETLYKKFPGLKQYRQKECCIQIHLKNRPDAEEIINLFLEEGDEISYHGVRVSQDGINNQINSLEEWKQLYKKRSVF